MKTQTIAGIPIALKAGVRYIATRPMAQWFAPNATYPVTIWDSAGAAVLTLPRMSYDEANEFLAEFNNGRMSFDGRVW